MKKGEVMDRDDLETLIDKASSLVSVAQEKNIFCDCRAWAGSSTSLTIKNHEKNMQITDSFEFSIRFIPKKTFFLSTTSTKKIDALLKHAKDYIHLQPKKKNKHLKQISENRKYTRFEKYSNISPEELFEKMHVSYHEASDRTRILPKSYTLSLATIEGTKAIISSVGNVILESYSESYFSTGIVALTQAEQEVARRTCGSRTGNKDLAIEKIINQSFEDLKDLLIAKPCTKGRYTVVIDNQMSGVLAHETVGHAAEADSVKSGESIFRKYSGKHLCGEEITVIDDPTIGYGRLSYDDEGTKTIPVEIIKNGRLQNLLHSLETAEYFQQKPTGNARAMNYSCIPIVRMRTTYFKPGKFEVEELFEGKEIIYFVGMSGGSVNPITGAFVFKPKLAYLMNKGEKVKSLKNVILSGNIIEALGSIEMLAKDFVLSEGYCGKDSQRVPVGDGGPHIRISNLLIG